MSEVILDYDDTFMCSRAAWDAAIKKARTDAIEECAAIADDKWGDPIIADAIRALNEVQP